MNANEVVKRHVERDSRFQVVQLLAERIGEPRKASQMHSHAQVGAFDVTGGYSGDLRAADDLDWYSVQNLCRRIPIRPFAVLPSVNFDELRVVHFRSEAIFDGGNVRFESVRRKLETADSSLAQIAGKDKRALGIPLANVVGQNQLGFAVQSNPSVGIAPLFGIVRPKMRVFRVNVGPQFVSLDKSRFHITDTRIEHAAAFVSYRNQKRKNRVLVNASDARNCANTHSLGEKRDDLRSFFSLDVVPSEGLFMRFGERRIAGRATKTLDFVASVKSESFCLVVVTSNAGHVGFSLVFLREKPDNQSLGSECGLRPRLDSSLPSASTDGREFFSVLSSHSAPINIVHVGLIESVKWLSIRSAALHKSVSRLNEPSESGVKNGERIRVSADVCPPVSEGLHYICGCHSNPRKRHQNLTAQFRKSSGGSDAILGKRFKSSDSFFQLGNSLSYECQFGSPLLKLLLGSHVAGNVRVEVNVSHDNGERLSWLV